MSRVLTPCLPWKSCAICEARMFPKSASPEKRAAKYMHQAEQYGRVAVRLVYDPESEPDVVYALARSAGRFVTLALRQRPQVAA